jgi:hypothetical protein
MSRDTTQWKYDRRIANCRGDQTKTHIASPETTMRRTAVRRQFLGFTGAGMLTTLCPVAAAMTSFLPLIRRQLQWVGK